MIRCTGAAILPHSVHGGSPNRAAPCNNTPGRGLSHSAVFAELGEQLIPMSQVHSLELQKLLEQLAGFACVVVVALLNQAGDDLPLSGNIVLTALNVAVHLRQVSQ